MHQRVPHRDRLSVGLAAAAFALVACAAPAGPERADAVSFDPDHVVEVDVAIAPSHWDALRAQTRSWVAIYDACQAAPFESPFTWFDAAVTIDGVRADARVRKRGFLGSLDDERPSLRIRLDGAPDVVLHNAKQDPSLVRQCLAYATFAAAALPAPRCNFARVRVNGADLGVYVHVEDVDGDFLARHFGDAGGALYEGTYSDFRAGWTDTFEVEEGAGDPARIAAVVDALERPDDEVEDALAELVDVDALLRFWAVEELVGHRDGFVGNANNYFLYDDPTSGRLHLIPWGVDQTFFADAADVVPASMAPWRLARIESARQRYLATRRAVLDAWDEAAVLAEIDRMEALLAPATPPLDDVRAFVRGRRAALEAPPALGPLNEPLCFEELGELRGALATTFGTTAADAFTAGAGDLAVTLDGAALAFDDVGAAAGWDAYAPGQARLELLGARADGTVELLVLQTDAARLAPGATLPIDWVAVVGILYEYAPATGALSVAGLVPDGTLVLTEAAPTADAPVRAKLHGRLVRSPR